MKNECIASLKLNKVGLEINSLCLRRLSDQSSSGSGSFSCWFTLQSAVRFSLVVGLPLTPILHVSLSCCCRRPSILVVDVSCCCHGGRYFWASSLSDTVCTCTSPFQPERLNTRLFLEAIKFFRIDIWHWRTRGCPIPAK